MSKIITDEYSGWSTAANRYYHRNKERICFEGKQRRKENPDICKAEDKKYRDKNRLNIRKTNSRYKKRTRLLSMFFNAKQRARKRGLPFDIEYEDLVVPEFCPILGIRIEHHDNKLRGNSPSIDRIIPELGYVKGNIRIISHRANGCKSNLSVDILERLLAYIKGEI